MAEYSNSEIHKDDTSDSKDKIIKEISKVLDITQALVDEEVYPSKTPALKEEKAQIEDLLNSLKDQINPVNLTSLNNTLDDLLETVKGDLKNDVIKTGSKTSNTSSKINLPGSDKNSTHLFNTANDLANYLRNLIGKTNSYTKSLGSTQPLSKVSRDALNLNSLLNDLDNLDSSRMSNIDIDSVMDSISKLSKQKEQKQNAPVVKEKIIEILPEPVTFEDVVERVAEDIQTKLDDIGTSNEEGSGLVDELKRLAKAARSGNKQQLILSGRQCAFYINALAAQLKEMADKIPCKNERERQQQSHLIRAFQGLRNYGTQLKILTSVKASSIEEDKDTDESLNSITRGIGKVITDGLSQMDIVRKTILKI